MIARPAPTTALLLLAPLLALLQGCVTAPPAAEPPAPRPTAGGTKEQLVPPQRQAELSAALALVKAEQYEQSVEPLQKLAAALPDNAIPPTNLALVYLKLGKLELAEAQLKHALEIEPTNPVASNELGQLYRRSGRFAEARPVYEKVLAKYPNFGMAHKNLGVLCDLYLRDYACALSHYQAYAVHAPQDKSVQIWIADLQKRTGQ
jgi:Flp pilus assembly protein TadD